MTLQFRNPSPTDAEAASRLIRACFDRHVAPDWSVEACATFRDEVSAANLGRAFGSSFFCEVCVLDDQVVGIVALPNPRVVSLTFVASEHSRKGIASDLLEHGLSKIESAAPDVSLVSLNSTRYAVPFYASQGFFPVSPEFEHCGTRATRMALWLPYYDSIREGNRSANLPVNRTRRFMPSFSGTTGRRVGYLKR